MRAPFVACLLLIMSVPAFAQAENPHPLIDKIWSSRDHRFVALDRLVEDMVRARMVLLGETHDNPRHHRIQADLLRRLTETGRRPALVWEMVERRQQPVLDRPGLPVQEMGAALQWEKRGWPSWSDYQPIAEIARAAGLAQIAGNLDRPTIGAMIRSGKDGIPQPLRDLIALPRLSPAEDAGWRREIVSAHCDMLPAASAGPMVAIQRARDGSLAVAMTAGAELSGDGAVLIAGSGHVRRDQAVPDHLARLAPDATIFAFAPMEVRTDSDNPEHYGAGSFDYVWFTERADRDDPCEQFRRHMERKHGKGSTG